VYTKSDSTLSLCDADPGSIEIRTFDPYADGSNCADPEEVKMFNLDCTSAEITFRTRNEMPKIREDSLTTYVELTGSDHEVRQHEYKSEGLFIVDDVSYAKRFAKALRHAVELCGGRSSKF
jgi:hypothetical protein